MTFALPVELQPLLAVTVQPKVSVPAAPAVKATLRVPAPAAMLPPLIVQAYDAPAPASGTEAVLLVEPEYVDPGAVTVEDGAGVIVTVKPPMLEQPALFVTAQPKTTEPLALAA